MNRKNMLLKVGALILLVGLVLFGIGFAVLDMDFAKLDSTQYSEVNESVNIAGLTDLEIDFEYSDVKIIPVENSGSLTVEGLIADDSTLTITTEGNKLKLRLDTSYEWWMPVFFNSGSKRSLTVSIPVDAFKLFEISVDSGDVSVSDFDNLSSLKVTSFSGDISLAQISAALINADAKSGKIQLNEISSDAIKTDCSSGRTNMEDVNAVKEINISVSSGSTVLTNVVIGDAVSNAGLLTVKNLSGAIRINNSVVYGDITTNNSSGNTALNKVEAVSITMVSHSGTATLTEVKCVSLEGANSSGSYVLTRLDAEKIDLKCSSGGIRGTIVGKLSDYRITANVNSGTSNLNNTTSGNRILTLKVNSGTIKVSFEQ